MTQEDKLLLLKDLCMRLPYGIKVKYNNEIFNIDYISALYGEVKLDIPVNFTIELSEIKPYLRRISSMTMEECEEYQKTCLFSASAYDYNGQKLNFIPTVDSCNWLLKNHFDFQDLIPKGLAIEVMEQNNPYKD